MDIFDYYFISPDMRELIRIVSSGPARWANPSYPNLKSYGVNVWSLTEPGVRFNSFRGSKEMTDIDFDLLIKQQGYIKMPVKTYKVLYG